jgi:hypothetical protein
MTHQDFATGTLLAVGLGSLASWAGGVEPHIIVKAAVATVTLAAIGWFGICFVNGLFAGPENSNSGERNGQTPH